MACTECGDHVSWPSEVQLCDKCMAKVPPIKLVGKPIRLIWEADFSRLVSRVYGVPYRFQQQDHECRSQNSIWTFTVPENLDDWDMDGIRRDIAGWLNAVPQFERGSLEWDLYWMRDNYPDFDAVMADLRRRELLDPGDYALHIWW